MPSPAKIFVLDTSVLLADSNALCAFAEHEIVIPVVVLVELESKRSHPIVGWHARQALHALESLREKFGGLTDPVPVNDAGGTVRVELNSISNSEIPVALQDTSNDYRILSVAKALATKHPHKTVTIVTKDLPLRLKASLVGLDADAYKREMVSVLWDGYTTVHLQEPDPDFVDGSPVTLGGLSHPVNSGVVMRSGTQSLLGRVHVDGRVHPLRSENLFKIQPHSAEQRFAIDLLLDPTVGIVSLGGSAGTGKSLLAIAAGLHATLKGDFSRVLVFRPMHAVGAQDVGFLPGNIEEKMLPWTLAIQDVLEYLAGGNDNSRYVKYAENVDVEPFTFLRGRTLTNTFIIIDEAQNIEREVLLTTLSRVGAGSRVVLTHDIDQRDNPHVGRYDGVASVVETLKNHALFGHVTLKRPERSEVAALVTKLLLS